MENTLENKAKFLGIHIGGKIISGNEIYTIDGVVSADFSIQESSGEIMTIKKGVIASGDFSGIGHRQRGTIAFETSALYCKPLSSISDEDSEKVSLLWSEEAFSDNHSLYGRFVLDTFKNIEQRLPCEVTDFLRSKGYALPYMGLSVEQQVEYGWVRLSE